MPCPSEILVPTNAGRTPRNLGLTLSFNGHSVASHKLWRPFKLVLPLREAYALCAHVYARMWLCAVCVRLCNKTAVVAFVVLSAVPKSRHWINYSAGRDVLPLNSLSARLLCARVYMCLCVCVCLRGLAWAWTVETLALVAHKTAA